MLVLLLWGGGWGGLSHPGSLPCLAADELGTHLEHVSAHLASLQWLQLILCQPWETPSLCPFVIATVTGLQPEIDYRLTSRPAFLCYLDTLFWHQVSITRMARVSLCASPHPWWLLLICCASTAR